MNAANRGGRRAGAGRPAGTGKFGSPTKTIRVPSGMEHEILGFIEAKGFNLPFYSVRVRAGQPAFLEIEEEPETINLSARLVVNPKHTFIVAAQGDSMINAGIHDSDLLVVDGKIEPGQGSIVVASVNGEFTVKRLGKRNGQTCLLPENPAYQPILLSDSDELHIFGVVMHAIHKV